MVAVAFLTLLLLGNTFASDTAPIIRKRVSEVQLTLVATDRNDRPVLGLSPADITVLEDGRPIPHFELRSAADLPLRVGIVLDLSGSTQKSWNAARATLIQSLGALMRPGDQLLILAFNSKIEMERTMADPAQLETALEQPASGGLTALYDTIYHVCGHSIFVGERQPHRSALILFSDGEDDLSLHGLQEAIAKAEINGISIYTVTTHNPKVQTGGDAVLHEIAGATGGRDFVVKDVRQLQSALSTIQEELRSSYLLYYHPPDEVGSRAFRRVYVLPTQPDGSQVRSRAGYFTAP
jgi:Ca-activated chloride channel homolog